MLSGIKVGDAALITRNCDLKHRIGIINSVHRVGHEGVFTVKFKNPHKIAVFRRIDFIHASKMVENAA